MRHYTIVVSITLAALLAGGCPSGGETSTLTPDTTDTSVSSDVVADEGGTPDAVADEGGTPDAVADEGGAPDAVADEGGTPDAVADEGGTPDAVADEGGTPDAAQDTSDAGTAEVDAGPPPIIPPTLVVEDQTLAKPFDVVTVKTAALPSDATADGELRIVIKGGADDGTVIGTAPLLVGQTYDDLAITLNDPILATQQLAAEVVDSADLPFPGVDGTPVQEVFSVVGDTENPELTINSQELDPSDLKALNIDRVYVPERFKLGVWLAIYEDDNGGLGTLRGKEKFLAGESLDTAFFTTSDIEKAGTFHAVLRIGSLSGGWSSSSDIVTTLDGEQVGTTFYVDSDAFRPVLEIADQQLVQADEVSVAKITIPEEYFYGWVAIYADDNGSPGALIGNKQFTNGTKVDQIIDLDVSQQGQQTLHAALHPGQTWADAQNSVMLDQGGNEVRVTFIIGGADLSYITATPYTTTDPRIVRLERAYSFDKHAWIVLARDDNGQPGTIIAQKRVLPKFAGNVWFHKNTGDFLSSGSTADYLTGQPGTFRRAVRGDETLHVLMYEDDPPDNQFTYNSSGGTEDVPVLDANNQPVTALFDVTVTASVSNAQKDSPRYYLPCPLSQHYNNPTALPVDCRCHTNIQTLDFPECKSTIADGLGIQYGDGPRVRTLNFGRWRSGFTEPSTNELIALAVWKDNTTVWPENQTTIDVGAVFGVDAETRERRIISGRYDDPTQGIIDVGTGPVLSHPFEIQKGPDGQYYVASYGYVRIEASLTPTVDIIKVDPVSGDREYVWRSNHLGFNLDDQVNPYGHCANGRDDIYGYWSVQVGRKAFGIDGDGNFYLSYAHNGNTPNSDGIGIIKVGADGSTCDFVTRTKTGPENLLYQVDIGTGPEPQAGPYKGMLVKDGKLYTTTEITDELWEVDIVTGNRTALHTYGVDDTNTGSSGTHVVWDSYRNLMWQIGFSSAALLYDPATGTSEPLWCPENYRDYKGINCKKMAAWGNNGLVLERGMWMHPTSPDYVFVVNAQMIQRVHLASGTSEIFSY